MKMKFRYMGKIYELKGEVISARTSIEDIKESDEKGLYIWTLGNGGDAKKNCPACVKHSGKVRSLKRWKQTAIPGHSGNEIKGSDFSVGKFGTFCEEHCSCKLIRIDDN